MARILLLLALFASQLAWALSAPEIEVVAGAEQRVPAHGRGLPFTIRVSRDGQPVRGATVLFAQGPGARIDFDPSIASLPVTDANGLASTPPWTARAEVGAGSIAASVYRDPSGEQPSVAVPYFITGGAFGAPFEPLWWGGEMQSGWGLAMPQHGASLFPVYFTYDASGRPTWSVLEGSWTGASYQGRLQQYRGSPYYAFDTTKVRAAGADFGTLAFDSATSARFVVNFDSTHITPPLLPVVASLKPFDFSPQQVRPERGVSDIWWGGPGESGWGISIAEDHGNLFVVWFTYDANGSPIWFSMPEGAWTDASTWKGPVYLTSGSPRLGSYDPSRYRAVKVGDFTLRFPGAMGADFEYTVEGHSGTLTLQRFDY